MSPSSDVVSTLFGLLPDGWWPQFAVGTQHKKALAWFPGKKARTACKAVWIPGKPLLGLTQLAFRHQDKPMDEQEALICWLGLDIDEAVPEDEILLWCATHPHASARRSCSGKGLHLYYQLAMPVRTNWKDSQWQIKFLTKPLVETCPWKVDKADRRLFWVDGGKNRWLMKAAYPYRAIALPDHVPVELKTGGAKGRLEDVAPGVLLWLGKLVGAGLIPAQWGRHIPVHAGSVIRFLWDQGERVETQSPMSNSPHTNAYLDVSECEIQLWTFADHAVVWRYQDIDSLIGGFNGNNQSS